MLRIPFSTITKVYYKDEASRRSEGREIHVIYRSSLNVEEGDIDVFLLESDFKNGKRDVESFFVFLKGKVPILKLSESLKS